MEVLKKIFPFSFKFETTKQFVWTIILYVIACVVIGITLGFMGRIPFIGWVFRIANYLTYPYCCGGVVLSILHKVGVIK